MVQTSEGRSSNEADSDGEARAARGGRDTIKETIESIVMAFILAFVFRAFVVEAFVIPTGSMAPTLLGEHLRLTGPTTGYRFNVDPPDELLRGGRLALPHPINAIDPMSHDEIPIRHGARVSNGDRILVLKYLYFLNEPRRWDVVVFKNPHKPEQNYIKRLVGLPGEQLLIVEGNVYVKPDQGRWRIARKTDAGANPHAERIQRRVWRPIHDTAYAPIDASGLEASPWKPARRAGWRALGRAGFRLTDETGGELRFDLGAALDARPGLSPYLYPYNHLESQRPAPEPIEDVRLEAVVTPDRSDSRIRLCTSARTDRSPRRPVELMATWGPDGVVELISRDPREPGAAARVLARAQSSAPSVGEATRLELWYVDQELSAWRDGRKLVHARFDIPMETIVERPPLSLDVRQPEWSRQQPRLRVAVANGSATIHRLRVDRDLYYKSVHPSPDNRRQGRGTLAKGLERELAAGHVNPQWSRPIDSLQASLRLKPDEFFCLGDNSPMSHDGRFWSYVDPWIDARYQDGTGRRLGVVPRELMMGKAFFVYFPAPFRWTPRSRGVIPNFGDMRFIH